MQDYILILYLSIVYHLELSYADVVAHFTYRFLNQDNLIIKMVDD